VGQGKYEGVKKETNRKLPGRVKEKRRKKEKKEKGVAHKKGKEITARYGIWIIGERTLRENNKREAERNKKT